MNSKLPSGSYSVLRNSSSEAVLSMSAFGKQGRTRSSLTGLEQAAKASKIQMGTFHVSSSSLFTSSNYLHFHMNFFPLFLPYLLFLTAQLTALEGVTKQNCYLARWQWKKEKNATTWQVTAQQNPSHKLGPSCTTAIYRYTIAKQEVTAVVGSANPASASCKYWEQNNEILVPSSRSKAKTTAQQPPFFWTEASKMILVFFHFPQWVHKMFIRIILLF